MVTKKDGMVFGYLPRLAVAPITVDSGFQLCAVGTDTSRRIDRAIKWAAMHHSRKHGCKRPQEVKGCRLPDDILKFMGSSDFL